MPIEIEATLNADKVLRGAKDIESSFDKVADSLDDVARDARRDTGKVGDATDKLAADVDSAGRDTSRSTERMERSFKELADTAKKETNTAGNDIGKNLKAGTDVGSDGLKDMKGEALSTAKESAASFSSIEDAADSLQEILANAFVGFGPAGAAAGLAAAIGIGFAIAAGEASAEAINDAKEKTGQLALAIVDAGGDIRDVDIASMMREWAVEIADNKEWWEFWQEGAVSNLDKARKAADAAGTDFTTMFRAMSGQDPEAAIDALKALDRQIEANWDRIRELQAEDPIGTIFQANGIEQATKELEANRAQIELATGSREDAVAAAEALEQATEKETRAAEKTAAAADRVTAANEARTEATDSLIAGVDAAVGAFETYRDKESKVFDPAAYIAGMTARNDATAVFGDNVLTLADKFGLSQEESQAILDQGIDFAQPLQDIINSGMDDEFINEWRRGRAGAEAAIRAGNYNADGTVTVRTRVDTSAYDGFIAGVRNRTIDVPVSVRVTERAGSGVR